MIMIDSEVAPVGLGPGTIMMGRAGADSTGSDNSQCIAPELAPPTLEQRFKVQAQFKSTTSKIHPVELPPSKVQAQFKIHN
jgi:hypothetical protein